MTKNKVSARKPEVQMFSPIQIQSRKQNGRDDFFFSLIIKLKASDYCLDIMFYTFDGQHNILVIIIVICDS